MNANLDLTVIQRTALRSDQYGRQSDILALVMIEPSRLAPGRFLVANEDAPGEFSNHVSFNHIVPAAAYFGEVVANARG